jgi:hypothetical protein
VVGVHSCPKCSKVLMDFMEDGTARIRTRLLLVGEDGKVTAICPQCKTPCKIPMTGLCENTRKKIKHVVLKSETEKVRAVKP